MTEDITQQGVCRQAPLRFLKALLLLTTMTVVSVAQAATIIVTSNSDELDPGTPGTTCTLRGAVGAINSGADDNGCTANGDAYDTNDTVVFDGTLAGKTVLFTAANGTIIINKPLTIKGPSTAASDPANRVTLQGGGSGSDFRLLDVATSSQLTIEDLNFTGGNVATGSGFAGGGAAIRGDTVSVSRSAFNNNVTVSIGGAIYADDLIIDNASFSSNSAGDWGGAICADTVTIDNASFSDNSTDIGGAIWTLISATISNATFSGNTATNQGGAIFAGGTTVANSTFSGNEATNQGGAIYAGTLTGRHLTLVNNTAPNGAAVYAFTSADLANSLIAGGDANAQCAGGSGATFTSAWNLVANMPGGTLTDDVSCGATSNTQVLIASVPSITTIDQIVETTLADNGGPTETLALAVNSPAIATADPSGATSQMLDMSLSPPEWIDAIADQRGFSRKAGNNARDLGAYEVNDLKTLAPETLPDGTIGTPYPSSFLDTDGGVNPYTYAVSSGSLPPGLTLSSDGGISGTPTAAGTYTFVIAVADSSPASPLLTGRSYTIIIGAKATATSIPLLGPWGLVLLAGLLGVIGWRRKERNS